eukprot:scaffold3.g6683.t1
MLAAMGKSTVAAWESEVAVLTAGGPSSANRQVLQSPPGTSQFDCVAASACAGFVAAAGTRSGKPAVCLWRLGVRHDSAAPPPCAEALRGLPHTEVVRGLAFSPSGALLATLGQGRDEQLCVYSTGGDGAPAALVGRMHLAEAHVALCFLNATHLAAVSATRLSRTPKEVKLLPETSQLFPAPLRNRRVAFVGLCAVSGGGIVGQQLVVATATGDLLRLGAEGRVQQSVSVGGPGAAALVVHLASRRSLVACACADGGTRLFSAARMEEVACIPAPEGVGAPTSCALGASGQTPLLSVAYTSGLVASFDMHNLSTPRELQQRTLLNGEGLVPLGPPSTAGVQSSGVSSSAVCIPPPSPGRVTVLGDRSNLEQTYSQLEAQLHALKKSPLHGRHRQAQGAAAPVDADLAPVKHSVGRFSSCAAPVTSSRLDATQETADPLPAPVAPSAGSQADISGGRSPGRWQLEGLQRPTVPAAQAAAAFLRWKKEGKRVSSSWSDAKSFSVAAVDVERAAALVRLSMTGEALAGEAAGSQQQEDKDADVAVEGACVVLPSVAPTASPAPAAGLSPAAAAASGGARPPRGRWAVSPAAAQGRSASVAMRTIPVGAESCGSTRAQSALPMECGGSAWSIRSHDVFSGLKTAPPPEARTPSTQGGPPSRDAFSVFSSAGAGLPPASGSGSAGLSRRLSFESFSFGGAAVRSYPVQVENEEDEETPAWCDAPHSAAVGSADPDGQAAFGPAAVLFDEQQSGSITLDPRAATAAPTHRLQPREQATCEDSTPRLFPGPRPCSSAAAPATDLRSDGAFPGPAGVGNATAGRPAIPRLNLSFTASASRLSAGGEISLRPTCGPGEAVCGTASCAHSSGSSDSSGNSAGGSSPNGSAAARSAASPPTSGFTAPPQCDPLPPTPAPAQLPLPTLVIENQAWGSSSTPAAPTPLALLPQPDGAAVVLARNAAFGAATAGKADASPGTRNMRRLSALLHPAVAPALAADAPEEGEQQSAGGLPLACEQQQPTQEEERQAVEALRHVLLSVCGVLARGGGVGAVGGLVSEVQAMLAAAGAAAGGPARSLPSGSTSAPSSGTPGAPGGRTTQAGRRRSAELEGLKRELRDELRRELQQELAAFHTSSGRE